MTDTEQSSPVESDQAFDREQAVIRIKRRRDFASHAVVFVVVNAAIWAVWAATGAGYPWPAWITGIWAVGLVLNGWDVYLRQPITESDIAREIARAHPRH